MESEDRPRILITGSSGYVGYVLSRFFSEKGIKVLGIDMKKNPVWKGNHNFSFKKIDITDKTRLENIFKKFEPSHVIHLAFLMKPLHDKKREHDIDVIGSKIVIELSDKTSSVRQLIEFSSTSAYGAWPENNKWIDESQELRPRDYRYGINKKKVEKHFNNYPRRKNLKLVVLRMCTAVGPRYHKQGGVVKILANSPIITKPNNRSCELQFIHEDDLKRLIHLIIQDEDIEGTYNLAPDSYSTTTELASSKIHIPLPLKIMRFIMGILWKLRLVSMRPAAITLTCYGIVASPKKLMQRYNYRFRYSTKKAFFSAVKERKRLGTL